MRTYQNVLAVLIIILFSGCSSVGRVAPTLYLSGEAQGKFPAFFEKVQPDKGDPMIKRTCKIDRKEFPCTLMRHREFYYVFKTNENGYITLEYRIFGYGVPLLIYKEGEAI